MSATFNSAYKNLVEAWKRREELRAMHADTQSLMEAKRDLDNARIDMMRVRGF